MRGLIVKGIAGFYYVKVEDKVYQCKARGIFKKNGIVPTVGDYVSIEVLDDGDAVINEILPRKNIFIRPPIANVDCFVVVIAVADPEPNMAIIDKFIITAEKTGIDVIICINKIDLRTESFASKIYDIYEGTYPIYCVSGETKVGIEALKMALAERKCALSGPSGVGKSTLLNALEPKVLVETGTISQKTKRGRHTTRHVEIFDMEFGGMIFDTPGFTSFEIVEAGEEELEHLYPEFSPYLGKCKYDNCRHLREPYCAIRVAVKEGKIKKERYRSYVSQILEIREREKNKYD